MVIPSPEVLGTVVFVIIKQPLCQLMELILCAVNSVIFVLVHGSKLCTVVLSYTKTGRVGKSKTWPRADAKHSHTLSSWPRHVPGQSSTGEVKSAAHAQKHISKDLFECEEGRCPNVTLYLRAAVDELSVLIIPEAIEINENTDHYITTTTADQV